MSEKYFFRTSNPYDLRQGNYFDKGRKKRISLMMHVSGIDSNEFLNLHDLFLRMFPELKIEENNAVLDVLLSYKIFKTTFLSKYTVNDKIKYINSKGEE